jgi:hypothetical protein
MSTRDDYELLLVNLHTRQLAGLDTIPDQLARDMDKAWFNLTEDETDAFGWLSEDLFIIEGKRRVQPLASHEMIADVERDLASAATAQDHAAVLASLRKLPSLTSNHVRMFGDCWDALGYRVAATCFYGYAIYLTEHGGTP